jgi:hypothetical protein
MDIAFNAASSRLCCFGHILNLICKAIIFGKGVDSTIGDNSDTPEGEA